MDDPGKGTDDGLIPTLLYIRQSLTRAGSESIATQIEVCMDAAPRLGARIIDVIQEPPSTSGYKNRGLTRPKFLELLERIREGDARAVMAYKSERLSRGGGPGWAPLFEAFEAAGWDPDRAVLTPSGWMSEFEIGIRATMDREESKKLSDRMLDARAREATAGKPRVGGRRPFGYSCSGVSPEECAVPECPHDGTLSIIPAEAAIIVEMIDRVLAGESLYSLAKDLERREVPTVTGKREWGSGTLTMILKNPRIAGLRAHNGEVVAEGTWPAIVDRATWERLVTFLDNREIAGGRRRSNERSFLLVGFLFCGRCGAKLRSYRKQVISGGKRDARVTGSRRCYACRRLPNQGGCARLQVVAKPVEDHVKHYVIGKLADPKYRQQLIRLAQADSAEADSLADQITELEEQRDTLLDLHLRKKVKAATYERRYDEVTSAIERLNRQAFRSGPKKILGRLPTSVEELDELWEAEGITFQRQLVDLVLDRVVVKPAPANGPRFDDDRLEWHPH